MQTPTAVRSRRAVVTGGTQGTGAAIAALPRRDGLDVWTTARSMPNGDQRCDRFVAADLTSPDGTSAVAEEMTAVGGVASTSSMAARSEHFDIHFVHDLHHLDHPPRRDHT